MSSVPSLALTFQAFLRRAGLEAGPGPPRWVPPELRPKVGALKRGGSFSVPSSANAQTPGLRVPLASFFYTQRSTTHVSRPGGHHKVWTRSSRLRAQLVRRRAREVLGPSHRRCSTPRSTLLRCCFLEPRPARRSQVATTSGFRGPKTTARLAWDLAIRLLLEQRRRKYQLRVECDKARVQFEPIWARFGRSGLTSTEFHVNSAELCRDQAKVEKARATAA